jgi:hypothetical protein
MAERMSIRESALTPSLATINGLVDHDNPPKRSLPVGGEGLVPCLDQGLSTGHTAGVGVLEDSHRRALKLPDQVGGGGNIDDIVETQLLALELLENLEEAPVQGRLLVRVFAIAKRGRLGGFEGVGSRQAGDGVQVRALLHF